MKRLPRKHLNLALFFTGTACFLLPAMCLAFSVESWAIDKALSSSHRALCPLTCSTQTPDSVSESNLKEFIRLSQTLPARYLSSYSALLGHCELLRRFSWADPKVGRIAQPERSDALVRSDLEQLIRALYLRSISNKQFAQALARKSLAPGHCFFEDTSVEVRRLCTSYESQASMSALLEEGAVPVPSAPPPNVDAALTTHSFPELVAMLGSYIASLYADRIKNGPFAIDGVTIADYSAALIRSYNELLKSEDPQTDRPETLLYMNPHFPIRDEVLAFYNDVDPLGLVRFCVFYTDWLELQCWLAQLALPDTASQTNANTALVLSHISRFQEASGRTALPDLFEMHLRVTDLEFQFACRRHARFAEAPLALAKDTAAFILGSMRRGDPGCLDHLDGVAALAYMRSFSAHLDNAWSPEEFDAMLRVCVSQ